MRTRRGRSKYSFSCLIIDIALLSNGNSFVRPYPPVRFPPPPPPYTTIKPSAIKFPSRNRIERVNTNNNYTEFLKRSEKFQLNGENFAAIVCENRYLCELGLAAVDEKNATRSAHTLYKTLW